ncbi:MAG TPA: hypothetical protein VNA69_01775 [Thermoanaerobaculia bacterium]|nr:hypothetical protein [Thermoanaerobaculia bacterium]
MSGQPSGGQSGNVFFTGGFGEVDAALLHAIDDPADQVRQAEGLRHIRVDFPGQLAQVVEVLFREGDRFQFTVSGRPCFLDRRHEMHHDRSPLEE